MYKRQHLLSPFAVNTTIIADNEAIASKVLNTNPGVHIGAPASIFYTIIELYILKFVLGRMFNCVYYILYKLDASSINCPISSLRPSLHLHAPLTLTEI